MEEKNRFLAKILSLLILLVMGFGAMPFSKASVVYAAESSSGSVPTDGEINWEFSNNTLRLYGHGNINDFASEKDTPWYKAGVYYDSQDVKKIVIEDGITSIGNYAFAYFYYCDTIELGKDVGRIGEYAFYYASYYKKNVDLVIPEATTEINAYAFTNAYGLKNINIKSDNVKIGYEAFYYCINLENLIIGSPVEVKNGETEISDSGFENCAKLKNVLLASSVKSVGNNAFEDCPIIEKFYFSGIEEELFSISFGYDNEYLTGLETILRKDYVKCYTSPYDKNHYTYKFIDWPFSNAPFNLRGEFDGDMDFIKTTKMHSDNRYHWYELPDGTIVKRMLHIGEVNGECSVCHAESIHYPCPVYFDRECREISLRSDVKYYSIRDASPYYFLSDYLNGKNECVLEDGFCIVDGIYDFGSTPVKISGNVKLVLCAGCGITTSGGVVVANGKTLDVYSGGSTKYGKNYGYLIVTGAPDGYAGIGGEIGDNNYNSVNINIHTGFIETHGGNNASGIGASRKCNCNLNIYTATVIAYSGLGGAGIGSAVDGSCTVTIKRYGSSFDPYVDAYASGGGAAIGQASNTKSSTKVYIYGSETPFGETKVSATAGYYETESHDFIFPGTAIGGGTYSKGDLLVEIHGGDIVADATSTAIGLAMLCECSNIFKIYGGNIRAMGCRKGTGTSIGCGPYSSDCTILIEGGTVNAVLPSIAHGGNNSSMGSAMYSGDFYLTVKGGTVIAEGLGIGRGYVNAPGGNVYVTISNEATVYSAGKRVTTADFKNINNTGAGSFISDGSILIVSIIGTIALITAGVCIVLYIREKKKRVSENKS